MLLPRFLKRDCAWCGDGGHADGATLLAMTEERRKDDAISSENAGKDRRREMELSG